MPGIMTCENENCRTNKVLSFRAIVALIEFIYGGDLSFEVQGFFFPSSFGLELAVSTLAHRPVSGMGSGG